VGGGPIGPKSLKYKDLRVPLHHVERFPRSVSLAVGLFANLAAHVTVGRQKLFGYLVFALVVVFTKGNGEVEGDAMQKAVGSSFHLKM
jgi:F0F1-type ATP synthase membrane subunit a